MKEQLAELLPLVFRRARVMKILLKACDAGPCDGGCRIVADALRQLLPRSDLVRLVSNHGTEHYGVQSAAFDQWIFDGTGGYADSQEWIRTFTRLELTAPRQLTMEHGDDEGCTVPRDSAASHLLFLQLHNEVRALVVVNNRMLNHARPKDITDAVYDALAQAPDEMVHIIDAYQSQCGLDLVRMFRSFVAKRRLRRSISFKKHLQEWKQP